MPHQMNELVEPSLAIVDGLARVVFLLGVIRVEETANARMTRAIGVNQLAVTSHTAPPPDVHLGLGIEFTRRQLDHSRKHVRFRIRIHPGPWRLAAEMRLGEVPLAPDIEQVLDSVEVEKNASLRLPAKKVYGPDLMIFGLALKETSASAIIFVPTASAERDCEPVATNTLTVCLPFCGFEKT